MKFTIIMVFAIYVTSVTAVTDTATDLRFPIDAGLIQGVLNKDNLVHIYYQLNENKTEVEYHLRDDARSCPSKKLEIEEDYKFDHFQIHSLNQDNILLVSIAIDSEYQESVVLFETANLSTCQGKELVLSTKDKVTEFKITTYADSFDIYFKDSTACKENYCKKSFDFEGNLISTPVNKLDSGKSIPRVQAIGSGMRSNKYLAFEFKNEKNIVNLVDSGKSKTLTEITDTEFSADVSTINNFISIAYRLNSTNLNVMQFDLDGNLKFESLVEYNYFVQTTRVINVPNGGVYLVASECDRDHCDDEKNVYSVKKIDANGTEQGSLLLKFPLPGIIEDLSFYEREDSYCITRAQQSLGVSGTWQFKKMDLISKCFTDKDFS